MQKSAVSSDSPLEVGRRWSERWHLDCFQHVHVCSAVSDSLQPHGL